MKDIRFAPDPNGGYWVYVNGNVIGYRRTLARAAALAGLK